MSLIRALVVAIALMCLPALAATMQTELLRLADTRGSRVLVVFALEGRNQAIQLEILRGPDSQALAFLNTSAELQDLLKVLQRAREQVRQSPTGASQVGTTAGGVFTLATTAQGRVSLGIVNGTTIHLTPADLDRLVQALGQAARVLRR